jgi:hypothetical protein
VRPALPRHVPAVLALASLALCVIIPVLYFLGRIYRGAFERALLFASLAWFIFATLWALKSRPSSKP